MILFLLVCYVLGAILCAFLATMSDEAAHWKALAVIGWPITAVALVVALVVLIAADRIAFKLYQRKGRY